MNLQFVKDLHLSWPLSYSEHSTKGLAGIKIKIQNPTSDKLLGRHSLKNNPIHLLSSLLLKINESFNLVSLEGNYNSEVSAHINLDNTKVNSLINDLRQKFELISKAWRSKANLSIEEKAEVKHYKISGGLTIFKLIKGLGNKINDYRKGGYTKKVTAVNLITVSSGETRYHTSDMELMLNCGGVNNMCLDKIRWLVSDFAKENNICII